MTNPWPMAFEQMTIRDYFAAAILPAVTAMMKDEKLAVEDTNHFRAVAARNAYAYADAMLEARKR